MAISGGGIDTSFIKYLETAYDPENPPKILLWEVPGHYRLNTNRYVSMLEQLLGMLDRDCKDPVATATIPSLTSSKLILEGLEQKIQDGTSYTLSFIFSEPISGNFLFIYRIVADNGQGEKREQRYRRLFIRRDRAGEAKEF